MTEPIGRIVVDADVLAADLFDDGPARQALDRLRSHSWLSLIASEPLLKDTRTVIAQLATEAIAADWRQKIGHLAEIVDHPPNDHPAIATAKAGDARHLLTYDEWLRSAEAGATIRPLVETSVMHPTAFVRLFDPEHLYPEIVGGDYPGPDRDPRA